MTVNYSLKRILAGIDRGGIAAAPEVGTGYFTASREIIRSGADAEAAAGSFPG
ncbi:MAG: hypothetical protein HZC28_02905 [Spirochaetes bacterium]|nr:hypothetical protein [Spirochaetota bacterium]